MAAIRSRSTVSLLKKKIYVHIAYPDFVESTTIRTSGSADLTYSCYWFTKWHLEYVIIWDSISGGIFECSLKLLRETSLKWKERLDVFRQWWPWNWSSRYAYIGNRFNINNLILFSDAKLGFIYLRRRYELFVQFDTCVRSGPLSFVTEYPSS